MKYLSLLLFIIAAIVYPQTPGYGYIRGRVSLPKDFPVISLPVRINNDVVLTDENGYFISLCKSGKIEIEFQDTILHQNLPDNEILTTNIDAMPTGVLIKNYSTDKMPESAILNNEELTDIRYVNNSIWLPQCYKKQGLLTLNHSNEFSVPFNSSSIYDIINYKGLIILDRKMQPSAKLTIEQFSQDDNLSFRYLIDDTNWCTAILKAQNEIANLPQIKLYIIKFNMKTKAISERQSVDLSTGNKTINIKDNNNTNMNKQHFTYQDLNGYFQSNVTSPSVNRLITDDGIAFIDKKKVTAPIEENTTILMSDINLPEQYTRYKWLVFENDKWRTVETEWLSFNNTHPNASIHKLKSGTTTDLMAYSTSTYIPKVWFAENVTIPYPDYAASITIPIKFNDLPSIKGRVTQQHGNLPSTSRLSISPIEIKPIIKNLSPEIERDLRIYNINLDINKGNFNIILPGYGKYMLKFYTTDHSFPENQMIIEKNMEKVSVNFQLK